MANRTVKKRTYRGIDLSKTKILRAEIPDLTLKKLSSITGVSAASLSEIENGRPVRARTLGLIAGGYGMNATELIKYCETGEKPENKLT